MLVSSIVTSGLTLFAVLFVSSGAQAQSWPSANPVRIVVAFGPWSASDVFARMVSEQLQKLLDQAVVVENKPGASGQIAAELIITSPGDGHTLFLTANTTYSANPHLLKTLRYDPIRDFKPVVRIAYFPFASSSRAIRRRQTCEVSLTTPAPIQKNELCLHQ